MQEIINYYGLDTVEARVLVLSYFDDPESVTEFLVSEGVSGNGGNPYSCPVAQWLREVAEPGTNVYVSPYGIRYAPRLGYPDIVNVGATETLINVITRIDRGEYPVLVAE